jgi:hypothetical protein
MPHDPGIQPAGIPQLVTRPNVEIVAAGTWALSSGEATFTPGDLAAAVQASQCPAIGSPVLKLGHVDPRFDGEPAVGRVTNLALTSSGNKITGDLAGMPAWLDVALASAYPNRSIEGYYNFACSVGHVHPFVITGLALLGVTPPGVGVLSSLADVAALYGVAAADGGSGRPWKTSGGPLRNQARSIPIRGAAAVMAAGVSVEDVRRAYYDNPAVPMSYWITEIQLAPSPQLIVTDEATAAMYRVPVAINGSDISFGDPVQVQVEYQDAPAPAKTTASRRPIPAAAQPLSPAEDADYRALFGGDPVQLQAGARNIPAPKPRGLPYGEAEAKIAAAIADGKFPRSRAQFYRDLAAKGDDLSVLDQLAGTPGLVLAGDAAQDPEDAIYDALFGGRRGDGSQPVTAAEAAEDSQYRALFPTTAQERARADARLAAAEKATAALSDQELMRQMFGQED